MNDVEYDDIIYKLYKEPGKDIEIIEVQWFDRGYNEDYIVKDIVKGFELSFSTKTEAYLCIQRINELLNMFKE